MSEEKRVMGRSMVEWYSPVYDLPDDDVTVLIQDADGDVLMGFLDGDCWRYGATGETVTVPVLSWAPVPAPPEAGNLFSHCLLAVVDEIRCEQSRHGAVSAIAKVVLYEDHGKHTTVQVPVTGIVEELKKCQRFVVDIKLRGMKADEKFSPILNATAQTPPDDGTKNL